MFRTCLFATLLAGVIVPCARAQESQMLFPSARSGNAQIILQQLAPGEDPIEFLAHDASEVFPAWSRNGKAIAFASNRTGRYQIYSADNAGAGLLQISLERTADALAPSWSPTGDRLVYQHGRDHHWQLVVISADGAQWRPIVHNASQPDWSPALPEGDRIVFVGAEHDAGKFLYTCDPTGTNIRRLQRLHSQTNTVYPTWSPDGKHVAYSDRLQKAQEIFVMSPDGQNLRVLTSLGRRNIYPTWSVDSKRIYFLHQRADHLWQRMAVDIETRAVETLEEIPAERIFLGARASVY